MKLRSVKIDKSFDEFYEIAWMNLKVKEIPER